MHEQDFRQLESELLRVGISPRHVRRTVSELREHVDDLVAAAVNDGYDIGTAQREAAQQMGDLQQVAIAMRAHPELRSWSHRYPLIAILVYPLTCLVLLPVAPVLAGVAHASLLARWLTCMVFGGIVTASIFLILQLSIMPG